METASKIKVQIERYETRAARCIWETFLVLFPDGRVTMKRWQTTFDYEEIEVHPEKEISQEELAKFRKKYKNALIEEYESETENKPLYWKD